MADRASASAGRTYRATVSRRVLAWAAGFNPEDAHTIAYASQYVDDSTEGDPLQLVDDAYGFDPIHTSWMGLESLGPDVQRKVYMPFHFVPGLVTELEPPGRAALVVTAGGPMVSALVRPAVKDRSGIRIADACRA